MTVRHDGLAVDWLGYATTRIEGPDGTVVYLDPGRYGVLTGEWTADSPAAAEAHPPATDYDARDGDVVCVTHDHHYDADGIRRVAREDATLVVYEAVDAGDVDRDVEPVAELPYDVRRIDDEADLLIRVDGDAVDEDGVGTDVVVRTVAAYNRPDGPNVRESGEPIHPEGLGCGFLVTLDGTTVFYPGDSDVLDGHAALSVSLFLAPISPILTMDRHAAADLAAEMDPDLVLPVHYNTFEALEADSGAFAADVARRGVPVVLDEVAA